MTPETNREETTSQQKIEQLNEPFSIEFSVVGIGASAGGLDAFSRIVSAIPSNSGMAWIFVQHLDPSHESSLAEILRKLTPLPLEEIVDQVRLTANHIYIIPSNKILQVKEDKLKLSPRPASNRGKSNMPIDIFFKSIAEVYESNAIGIVLSGTASDGTEGLRFIKEHGGITMAQSPQTAAYNGMPESAIESGMVDFILEPQQMPAKIREVARIITSHAATFPVAQEENFRRMLALLRLRKEMDFTYYKQTTIRRRILRRMVLNKLEDTSAYLSFLENNLHEVDLLYQDMLIPVTSFFRDKKVFDKLCESVFPSIIRHKSADGNIRIWIAGCSTGQEAYSMAICFKEYLGHKKEKVQIFATDLSERAILKARAGIYTKSEVESVSPTRLKEYFTFTNGSYRINKDLRDMCVFAVHNFLKDPPFSKIDFVSCRNVLIYMDSYLQKKALATFHYALNPKGLLLLGKTENTIGITDLFDTVGKNDKVFTRKDVPSRLRPHKNRPSFENPPHTLKMNKPEPMASSDFQRTADEIILNHYSPAGVVINENLDIVHFRGNTAEYLQQNPGKPTHNLLKMAKGGLGFELRSIAHKVKLEKQLVTKEHVLFSNNSQEHSITLSALPLPNGIDQHYLILFEPERLISGHSNKKAGKAGRDERMQRIQQLENEITQLREDMRIVSDEQEASNEELQSGNEELLSSNEELQSLNEELETSKEELQSTIEELTVVNQEMVNLNDQLTLEKEYAEGIITTIPQPMIVLDQYLRVVLANEQFYTRFGLTEHEIIGKPVYDMANRDWNIDQLRELLETMLPEKLKILGFKIEHHFSKVGDIVMLLNARVINKGEQEKLILLAIEDITALEQSTQKILRNEQRLKTLVDAAPIAICIFRGRELIIENPNQAFIDIVGKGNDIEGKPLAAVMPELITENQPFLQILDDVYTTGVTFQTFGTMVKIKKGDQLTENFYDFNYTPLLDEQGKVYAILDTALDVTEQVTAHKKIEQSEKYFRQLTDTVPSIIWITRPDGYCSYLNKPWYEYTGQSKQEGEGFGWLEATHPGDKEAAGEAFMKANNSQQPFNHPYRIKNKNGDYRWVLDSGSPKYNDEGVYEGMIGTVVDIHDEKLAQLKLQHSEEKLQGAVDAVKGIVWTNNEHGEMVGEQPGWAALTGQSYEQYQGYGWAEAVHPEDAPATVTAWKTAVAERSTYIVEHRLRVKDGSWRHFAVRAIPLSNLEGTIREWVGVHTDITEKKTAEKELMESEKRFRLLADQSPMHIFIIEENETASVSYWNKSWLHYTGQTFEEAIGRAWDGIVHADDTKIVTEIYQAAFTAGEPYTIPAIRLKRFDGSYRWHTFKANPRFNALGKFNGYVGVAFDIHDQKMVEAALIDSEHRFSNMIYSSPSMITILKGEDLIVEIANQAIIESWGKGPDVVGRPYFELLPELQEQGMQELLRKVYKTGEPVYANEMPLYLVKQGKKEMKFYDLLLQAHRNAKSVIEGVAIIATNVTPQAEFNRKIKQSEENFRQLSDLMPAKVTNANANGEVFYYNQSWVAYTGLSMEELFNNGWRKAMHPDEVDTVTARWQQSLETGGDLELEHRVKNRDGIYEWHLSRAVAVKDEDGKVLKWVGTTTEIQKIKEEEQRKEDFLKMVSHELKTPVTSIKGYVQLLLTMLKEKANVADIPLKTSLDRIDSQVVRLTRLITEMLDLSRIDAGKLELQKKKFNLNHLVRETVQDVLHTSQTHQIHVHHDYECTLEGDEDRIGQILINFLNNAIKYSEVNSDIHLRVFHAADDMVGVSVSDSGIGIDKKDHAKVFERFYRVAGESELSYSGFGIGLFIANQIVERHGGYITVDSEKEKGAVFTFFLPMIPFPKNKIS